MINILGTTIEAPKINDSHFIDNLLSEVAKKDSERKILKQFLIPRLSAISEKAQSLSYNQNIDGLQPQALVFYISQLKSTGAFENMVLQVINDKTSHQLLQGKQPVLPPTFPGDHKKAEALVHGSISSSIGDKECRRYLTYRNIQTRIQAISKDLFYAQNNGLDDEQSLRFMGIIYELDTLKTADFTNLSQLRLNIINSIKTHGILKIIHLKCLRYTYPNGNRLQVLDHINADSSPDHHLERHQSEYSYINKLNSFYNIFEKYKINIDPVVLLSDQDLIDYFPNGGCGVVPDQDIILARQSLPRYTQSFQEAMPNVLVKSFRDYLAENNKLENFDRLHQDLIRQLRLGQSHIPERYVESKIEHRFESNSKLFRNITSREFARDRVYFQIASLQALSVLGQEVVMIEEDSGNDNRYIGGHDRDALPVIFVKLKS